MDSIKISSLWVRLVLLSMLVPEMSPGTNLHGYQGPLHETAGCINKFVHSPLSLILQNYYQVIIQL